MPGPDDDLATAAVTAVELLDAYVRDARAGAGPVVCPASPADVYRRLRLDHWLAHGGMATSGWRAFLSEYLQLSTRLHHPHYLAHQVAVPETPAALADLVHGVINNPMAIYEMGPAAAAIEHAVVNWMLAKIGWRPAPVPRPDGDRDGGTYHAAGVLTHGGSLANLTALLAARAAAAPDAWRRGTPSDLVVLAPETAHYSVTRAVAMLGLGADAVVRLPVDDRDVVRADEVAPALARVRADGLNPMAVVINACSTGTGFHDPIEPVAAVCERTGVWLHVDACHGASALLSPRERHYLRGIERADSVVWDAHKMLRTSALCAAVLVRDGRRLTGAFRQQASYLFYDADDAPAIDSLHHTVECTKAALGFKLFLAIAWRGEESLRDYIEGRYAATRRFAALIRSRPGFECPFEPEANILCFRYGRDDATQVIIRERLLRDGRFHVTSAVVAGARYLRLTIMSPHTTDDSISALLDAVDAAGRALPQPGSRPTE